MSTDRFLDKKIANRKQGVGPNGLPTCRWCRGEVIPPKRTFCSQKCIHEWRIRSDVGYAKMNVEDRDKGICAYCKQDCTSQKLLLDEVRKDDRLLFLREIKKLGLSESTYDKRKVLWDLDHRVRVADGGGSASLDNLQTLCLTCHKTKTAYENSVTKKGRKRK